MRGSPFRATGLSLAVVGEAVGYRLPHTIYLTLHKQLVDMDLPGCISDNATAILVFSLSMQREQKKNSADLRKLMTRVGISQAGTKA